MDELVEGAHVEQESSQRTLNLGVVVVPYSSVYYNKKSAGAKTTADVAHILESKYHLFESFFNVKRKGIMEDIQDSMKGAMEAMIMGSPAIDPFGAATSTIDAKFRDFINSKESENVGIEGTPTGWALRGVNHRLKHPFARSNPRRPSFRDTGLLSASFKSWVD